MQIDALTTPEVAARLKVSRQHVLRLIAEGRIKPMHKLPGAVGPYLFDPAEVERVAVERGAA